MAMTNSAALNIARSVNRKRMPYTSEIARRGVVPSPEWRDASVKEIERAMTLNSRQIEFLTFEEQKRLSNLRKWLDSRKFN